MKNTRKQGSRQRLILIVVTGWAVGVLTTAAVVLAWRLTYLPAMLIADFILPVAQGVSK